MGGASTPKEGYRSYMFLKKIENSMAGLRRGLASPSQLNFFQFHAVFGKHYAKQVCIPVGCVSPASVATVNRMTDRQV